MENFTVSTEVKPLRKDTNLSETAYRELKGKVFNVTFDLSGQDDEGIKAWLADGLKVAFAADMRKQASDADDALDWLEEQPKAITWVVPEKGQDRIAPFTRAVNKWVDKGVSQAIAEKIVRGVASPEEMMVAMTAMQK